MKTLLKGAKIFNEGISFVADILINNQRIEKIESNISATPDKHL
jgi:dihydroorotase-like cyclic amidohydrolase